MKKYTIEITDEQVEFMENITGLDIRWEDDIDVDNAEYALKIIFENV